MIYFKFPCILLRLEEFTMTLLQDTVELTSGKDTNRTCLYYAYMTCLLCLFGTSNSTIIGYFFLFNSSV